MAEGSELSRVEDVRRREAVMAALAAQLRERAGIDPLTGLDSRSRFERRVLQEVKRGARNGHHTTVLVVDVRPGDGSRVTSAELLQASDAMHDALRELDTIARIGEGRFAALLPGCDGRCAGAAVERVIGRLRHSGAEVVAGFASTGDVMGWELLEAAELAAEGVHQAALACDEVA